MAAIKVQIEIELSEDDVQVLIDISTTPEPVKNMGFSAWASRADKLQIYSLVKIVPVGIFVRYSLTEQGERALRMALLEPIDAPREYVVYLIEKSGAKKYDPIKFGYLSSSFKKDARRLTEDEARKRVAELGSTYQGCGMFRYEKA